MLLPAGVKVMQCDFVSVNNGITAATSCLQLNVVNNHINARQACINGRDINQSCIIGNLFYKDISSQTSSVGVQFTGHSAWNVVSNNVSTPPYCLNLPVTPACWQCLRWHLCLMIPA